LREGGDASADTVMLFATVTYDTYFRYSLTSVNFLENEKLKLQNGILIIF
jgi:hypothetical protein